jgi:hypothetical protein
MYRPAGPTWKNSKRTQAEIREIHRTIPVMLRFLLGESDVDGSDKDMLALPAETKLRGPKMPSALRGRCVRLRRSMMPNGTASWICPDLGERVMRMSSSLVAPSTAAILSTALLCGLSGTAASQTATGPANQLPSITVDAPKQVARSQRPVARTQRPAQVANTVASRPTQPTPQTPPPAKGSTMAKLAALEKTSSNCTDGCQTSFKYGNQPWNGCSTTAGEFNFSTTCRNGRNYKTYFECKDTSMFLGARQSEAWWYCSSLLAGGKLAGEKVQVAELKRSGRR